MSQITAPMARAMLNNHRYLVEILGPDTDHSPEFIAWQTEWLERIAGGWTACDCARRHKGCCSSMPPGWMNEPRQTVPVQEALF